LAGAACRGGIGRRRGRPCRRLLLGAGPHLRHIRARVHHRGEEGGVAHAQGDHTDDHGGLRFRGRHGGISMAYGQDAGMGAVRAGAGLETDMSKRWYVVHAYSGFEKSVARTLQDRIARAGMQDKFGRILVPVEEVVEMKGGQKHMSERKFFPGYVLVEMEMNDDTWHLVKNTSKVTGFVGGTATKPAPIAEKEVDAIMQQMREGVEKPRPKVLFEVGEMVRVKDGPF